MKHTALLLFLAAAAITACSETDMPVEPPEQPSEPEIETPDFINIGRGFSAMAPVQESETNPDLLTDWENCTRIYTNELGKSGDCLKVTPPWRDGCTSALMSPFSGDISKKDGWIMLFHTFLSPSYEEVHVSYICFYNIFTGYVKVLYYLNDSNTFSRVVWSVLSDKYPTPTSLFSGSEYFSHTQSDEGTSSVWSLTAANESSERELSMGWNGFEFRVGEYNTDNGEGILHFLAYNAGYDNCDFLSESGSYSKGAVSAMNAAGLGISDSFRASANTCHTWFNDAIMKFARDHHRDSYLGFDGKDIFAKVGEKDYAGAIAGGLGLVYKTLFRDGDEYPIVKLQSPGAVSVRRTNGTPMFSTIPHLEVNLKEVLKHQPIDALGVWTLKQRPTLYYDRYTRFTADKPEQQYTPGKTYDLRGTAAYPATVVGDVDIVFNPAIKPYITSYTVSTGIIDVAGGNRDLDNAGKAIIAYNPDNLLADYGDIKAYGVSDGARDVSGKITVPAGTTIGKNTDFYIDWGENVGGNRAAVVTLTMNVDYMGRAFTVTESRVYDVTYAPSAADPATFNNPPHAMVLNRAANSPTGFDLSK